MRIPTTAVVTGYEPQRRYGYDITSKLAPAPSLMRYALEPVTGGTKLTLSNEAPLRGWMKLVEPLLERNVQAMFERDVARLKVVIEADLASLASPARSVWGPGRPPLVWSVRDSTDTPGCRQKRHEIGADHAVDADSVGEEVLS
jgi:hypothetical protein